MFTWETFCPFFSNDFTSSILITPFNLDDTYFGSDLLLLLVYSRKKPSTLNKNNNTCCNETICVESLYISDLTTSSFHVDSSNIAFPCVQCSLLSILLSCSLLINTTSYETLRNVQLHILVRHNSNDVKNLSSKIQSDSLLVSAGDFALRSDVDFSLDVDFGVLYVHVHVRELLFLLVNRIYTLFVIECG